MSLLIVERGYNAGKRLALNEFPATFGRDVENSFVVDDEEVSRFHFRIKRRGRLYICQDLESKNGTYVNGDRILNSIIKNGDKILIGSTEFQFAASEPDIHIANEFLNFDMVIDDDLGLKGPIEIGKNQDDLKYTPIRLSQLSVVEQLHDNLKSVKEIYDLHSNILVIDDLEEASKTLLKSIGQLIPSVSRAALFVWASANRQLIPYATRQYKKKPKSFLLSQRSLEDVLTRKQGVLLISDASNNSESSRNRIIFPMIHNNETICVIHLEVDNTQYNPGPRELEMAQALISRSAPSFEAMLLRREIDAWMVGMIETVIATIEAKDTYTLGHSERVSKYCLAIADELKLNREVKKFLLVSALCHDIGKIGIPDAILKKASLLSSEEYDEMKLHPSIGSDIISHMPNAHRFISGVKHHHEKWDGTGYPDGLAGENIPFFGRIVAIADVFDAMVSGRSYSGFMEQSDAVQRIVEEKELFDPEILKACVRAHESGTMSLKTSTANNSPDGGREPVTPDGIEDPKPSRIRNRTNRKK